MAASASLTSLRLNSELLGDLREGAARLRDLSQSIPAALLRGNVFDGVNYGSAESALRRNANVGSWR
jgi:hypothetical protein